MSVGFTEALECVKMSWSCLIGRLVFFTTFRSQNHSLLGTRQSDLTEGYKWEKPGSPGGLSFRDSGHITSAYFLGNEKSVDIEKRVLRWMYSRSEQGLWTHKDLGLSPCLPVSGDLGKTT